MTASAHWELDRLSSSAREAAEIASLGAGLSLSSWLAKLINDTCAAESIGAPAEAPKILEFRREIRDRAPAMPRFQPMPASTSLPAVQPMQAPSTPQLQPKLVPLSAPVDFRPMPAMAPAPIPPAAPLPAPTAVLAPVAAAWPPSVLPTPPQSAPVPQAPAQPPPAAVAPQPVGAGATMLPVAAMAAANLGTRRGDDVPEVLLADIGRRGVRQPVTVRRSTSNPEQFEIICGHRRWRAAQRVGLAQIPAIVVTQDHATAILASLTGNLQLADLSVIDEAQAYLRLLTQYAIDVSAITAALGCERQHIVQSMRLLGLPPLVRHLIGSGILSREHAFVLLDAPQPETLADAILAEHLSVEAARQRTAVTECKP